MVVMDNAQVVKILREIGEFLEMRGVQFKPRAYEKAAEAIGNLEEDLRDIYKQGGLKALEDVPGVGVSIGEKIEELIKTGKLDYYQRLKKEMPVNLDELTRVEGLGPKQVRVLYQKLGIKTLDQLEAAARGGKIRKVAGFGEKSEQNILRGIDFLRKSGGRFLLSVALAQAKGIEERLGQLAGVKQAIVAGSLRRRKETIGDLDFLVALKKGSGAKAAGLVMDFFTTMPEVAAVYAKGPTKAMVKLKSGLDADLRVVAEESYGAALNYFTGSKDHNVHLRQLAMEKGWKLSEYSLFEGKKQIAGRTEEEVYKKLGMDYIEPELRENGGEIEAARQAMPTGRQARGMKPGLPKLIGYGDLMGDLQVQTNWSDGADTIEVMAREAAKRGLSYILVTDHTKRLAMTNGLNEKRLRQQMKEIDELNGKFKKERLAMTILKGTECDILKSGEMDFPAEVLADLDIVGGSIHSYFNLSRKEQTERLKRVMRNPHVDIIMHPTGRLINRRGAIDVDMDEIIKIAKETGTVMEVNASPDRLDLKDEHIRKCVESGVKLVISSDAHNKTHFDFLPFGIAQARRGWATRNDIINAWPLEQMIKMLKK